MQLEPRERSRCHRMTASRDSSATSSVKSAARSGSASRGLPTRNRGVSLTPSSARPEPGGIALRSLLPRKRWPRRSIWAKHFSTVSNRRGECSTWCSIAACRLLIVAVIDFACSPKLNSRNSLVSPLCRPAIEIPHVGIRRASPHRRKSIAVGESFWSQHPQVEQPTAPHSWQGVGPMRSGENICFPPASQTDVRKRD